MRSRSILVVGLVVLVLLAGCSGGAQMGSDGAQLNRGGGGGGGEQAAEATAVASDGSGEDVSRSAAEPTKRGTNRVRIRTGTVVLEVRDYDAARRNLTATVRAYGGYVSGSDENLHREANATWTTGSVVLRVPKENFSAVFARVKARGTVLESSTQTKDVTEQLLDINARLKNLRAQRERLRTLYERANETEAILKISKRLSEVQSEIERLQAQKRSLRNRVAYATITVQLREPEPPEEAVEHENWYDTSVVTAFFESIEGLITVLRAIVVLAAYLAPYVLFFGSPLLLGGLAYWLRSR